MEMVKGITRQVILVKSPDPKLFEEAIFIVKEEALAREGVSADQVIRQARQAADGYLKSGRPGTGSWSGWTGSGVPSGGRQERRPLLRPGMPLYSCYKKSSKLLKRNLRKPFKDLHKLYVILSYSSSRNCPAKRRGSSHV